MKQYIDKSAVVAEIERLYQEHSSKEYIDEGGVVLNQLEDFLDTLEVKEVDFEKEIKNRIDSLSNLYCYMEDLFNGKEEEGVYPIPEKVTNELFEFAKYFIELGMAVSNKAQRGE